MTPLLTDEIIDMVREAGLDWHAGYPVGDEANRYETLARAVEARVREKMGDGWVACNERMPPIGEEVLVWLAQPSWGQPRVALDTWDEQHEAPVAWSSATIPVGPGWDSSAEWERVTHWRPLPPPPEGAGEKR